MSGRLLVLAGIVAVLLGCVARTDMTSFVDPAYRDGRNYSSVVIFAYGVPLEEQQVIEGAVVERFQLREVRALRGVDVVPPTRQVPIEEWGPYVEKSNVETVLIITAGGKDTSQTYVPPTSTYGMAQTVGNTTYLNMYQTPGYTISKPHAAYSAALIDQQNLQVVWMADATSRGNAFATFSDLGRSVAQEIVDRLVDDKLF